DRRLGARRLGTVDEAGHLVAARADREMGADARLVLGRDRGCSEPRDHAVERAAARVVAPPVPSFESARGHPPGIYAASACRRNTAMAARTTRFAAGPSATRIWIA